MTDMSLMLKFLNTVKYLRPVQIYGRIWFRLYRPSVKTQPAPDYVPTNTSWVAPVKRPQSLLGAALFHFLNEEHTINNAHDWDDPEIDKLWRYNLHYFDDLNSIDAESRVIWHENLIKRWVADNPPGNGSGWEPYPTSLRIVNWIKWVFAGHELEPDCLVSLSTQARWLSKKLEIHLLGNHLFANAKALVFAGIFFNGREAEQWLEKGLQILKHEIPEQILTDGGHFERSTMYHAIALEDMLDLCNILRSYSGFLSDYWVEVSEKWWNQIAGMLDWLLAMCHSDGEIGLFNDAALNIAPSPEVLEKYANRLGFTSLTDKYCDVTHLKDSGYVRINKRNVVALLDVAEIGPDYLPGHAHADTLSYELSLFGYRVLVNSGTSCYGKSKERLRQRGTAAHNTVAVDDNDSSEVWGGFRVARRAYPFDLNIVENHKQVLVECSHDGYHRLSGKVTHRRSWKIREKEIIVTDTLSGRFNEAVGYFHVHPDVKVYALSDNEGFLILPNNRKIKWTVKSGISDIKIGVYHPEFGLKQKNKVICVTFIGLTCEMRFYWD